MVINFSKNSSISYKNKRVLYFRLKVGEVPQIGRAFIIASVLLFLATSFTLLSISESESDFWSLDMRVILPSSTKCNTIRGILLFLGIHFWTLQELLLIWSRFILSIKVFSLSVCFGVIVWERVCHAVCYAILSMMSSSNTGTHLILINRHYIIVWKQYTTIAIINPLIQK